MHLRRPRFALQLHGAPNTPITESRSAGGLADADRGARTRRATVTPLVASSRPAACAAAGWVADFAWRHRRGPRAALPAAARRLGLRAGRAPKASSPSRCRQARRRNRRRRFGIAARQKSIHRRSRPDRRRPACRFSRNAGGDRRGGARTTGSRISMCRPERRLFHSTAAPQAEFSRAAPRRVAGRRSAKSSDRQLPQRPCARRPSACSHNRGSASAP